ncbi:Sm-like ribonucleo protein [Coprinellus micaceus]|uniref:LSM2-LSM8 complex subunit LSM8 n=1 Tax=Coprinellus micaceus TaxID=71717 RepID=A0A4Y7SC72_COPMI|nr:Sm-like ribonucleo protein [Coprinellus micaceus]
MLAGRMKAPRHVGAENISDAAFITSTQHRDLSCPMSSLQGYVDRRVELILQDGRVIIGILAGFDQKSNVVLSASKERVYSMDEGVEEIPLGLYLVKGDMIILIGELDEEIDQSTDLSTIRAEPLPPVRY